ncbi:MAG: hypothetical protein LBH60_06460 [Prevotellaceae bacterium]|nr:hypothetical protein [Prevotellaceae bacterium]
MTKGDCLPRNRQNLYDQVNMTTDYLTAGNPEQVGITGNALNRYNTECIP